MTTGIDPTLERISVKKPGDRITDEEARIITSVFRELYASVLRYVRGAGDLMTLVDNIRSASVIVDKIAYCTRLHVDGHLREAAAWKFEDRTCDYFLEYKAIDQICSGALQLVASRLLGPRPGGTVSRAFEEITDGIERYQEYRTRIRR